MDAREVHASDQAMAELRQMAGMAASYFLSLTEAGVGEAFAVVLTVEYQRQMLAHALEPRDEMKP